MTHKVASNKAFQTVSYYKSAASAKKLKTSEGDTKKKINYLVNSYGLYNLDKYLKPGKNKKLKAVVKNMANCYVKGVVTQWKK